MVMKIWLFEDKIGYNLSYIRDKARFLCQIGGFEVGPFSGVIQTYTVAMVMKVRVFEYKVGYSSAWLGNQFQFLVSFSYITNTTNAMLSHHTKKKLD